MDIAKLRFYIRLYSFIESFQNQYKNTSPSLRDIVGANLCTSTSVANYRLYEMQELNMLTVGSRGKSVTKSIVLKPKSQWDRVFKFYAKEINEGEYVCLSCSTTSKHRDLKTISPFLVLGCPHCQGEVVLVKREKV